MHKDGAVAPALRLMGVAAACAGVALSVPHRYPVLSGAALLTLSLLTTSVCASVAWHRHSFAAAPLEDAVHRWFPQGGAWAHYDIPNIMLLAQAPLAALLISRHAQRAAIVRRVTRVYAATMALRSVMLLSTNLPDSSPMCHTAEQQALSLPFTAHSVSAKAWDIFRGGGGVLTCGDMMFSGHTVVFTLLTLTWHQYLVPRGAAPILAWNAAGVAMIVITRLHYTVDVLVALCITGSVWREMSVPSGYFAPCQ